MVKARRDDELGESDENAELSVFDRILANFCGPFYALQEGRSPQSCTVTDFEMETSNFVLFSLMSIVSVPFWAIYDETIHY